MANRNTSKFKNIASALAIAAAMVYLGQRRNGMESHPAKITSITPLNSSCGSLKTRRVFGNCTRFQADVEYPGAGGAQSGKVVVAELDGHDQSPQSKGVPRVGDVVKIYVNREAGTLEADIARPNSIYWIVAGIAVAVFFGVRQFRRV